MRQPKLPRPAHCHALMFPLLAPQPCYRPAINLAKGTAAMKVEGTCRGGAGAGVTVQTRTSDLPGGLNRSTQHFTLETEVECDGVTTEATFLYGSGEC